MIGLPGLLRLPGDLASVGTLEELAVHVARLRGTGATVLLGTLRLGRGPALDAFCVASALAARGLDGLGVTASIGAGRAPSIIAREATAAALCGGCDVLVLEGRPTDCEDAARVVTALFTPGRHTLATATTSIAEAVNDPLPPRPIAVCWRDGDELRTLVDGVATTVGEALDVAPGAEVPAPAANRLVVPEAGQ